MRLTILLAAVCLPVLSSPALAEALLPQGPARAAIETPCFPDRVHTFVWRNWPVVEAERLARVLGTSRENVAAIAESMGLPPQAAILPEWKTRGYITVLRRNWHLLPYEQLLVLLDMTPEQLAYALREDDFLFIKLGSLKPQCPPLRYQPPDEKAQRRAAEIRRLVTERFGPLLAQPEEPRFAFVSRLSAPLGVGPQSPPGGEDRSRLRYIYSYFAMYGDPLLHPELDPYPDGLLERLSAVGVSGVWLHTVLRTLAPSPIFPEFGQDHEKRLDGLRRLVQRAKRYGIRVYLYMNEPRAMPEAFLVSRPDLRGVREGDHWAMCTSRPEVRQWMSDSLAYVFRTVPDLGGVFTITASENLTNCASHGQRQGCPRCKDRSTAEVIAEVNATIEAGVHAGNPRADVVAWDWGWPDDAAAEIIARLPKSVWLQSVSEWSKPFERGGVAGKVGEYSLSVVGPGPRAARHWELARKAGLKTVAKVQFSNTWELSAVPYVPVLDLVAEHCAHLASNHVDGMMLSWSLGGYPSPNLEVAQQFSDGATHTPADVLQRVAQRHFGDEGGVPARRAWSQFSLAFREFPYDGSVVYRAPLQMGPANPLYFRPTGYPSTMVGIPYDDLTGWRGPYPPETFAAQFEKVSAGWAKGLDELRQAVEHSPANLRHEAQADLRVAAAARLHFAAVANQTRFVLARDKFLALPPDAVQRGPVGEELRRLVAGEAAFAEELLPLVRQDSRLGYEASNQYYYLPIDLMEKVVNCRYLLEHDLK